MTLEKFSPEVQQHLNTIKTELTKALDGTVFDNRVQTDVKTMIQDFVDVLKLKSNLEPDFKINGCVDPSDANKLIVNFTFRPNHMDNLTPEARQLVYMAGESEEVQLKRIGLHQDLEDSRELGQIAGFEIQMYDPETQEFNVTIKLPPPAESITLNPRELQLRIKDQD